MSKFLGECQKSYDHPTLLEELDKKRFADVIKLVQDMASVIRTKCPDLIKYL